MPGAEQVPSPWHVPGVFRRLPEQVAGTQTLAPGSHENGTQILVARGLQRPAPSHAYEPTTASPSHMPGLHIVLTGYLRQPPLPSHLPSRPQVDTGETGQVVAARGVSPI